MYSDQKRYAEAEQLYRQALDVFSATLPADHLNLGIARIKLGRTLLRQGRAAAAERETLAGHAILEKQLEPSVSFLTAARKDLTEAYEALGQPERAARFRSEVATVPHAP